MEDATDGKLLADILGKGRLHDAALVVAALVPGVREEELDPLQGARSQALGQELYGDAKKQPNYRYARLIDRVQKKYLNSGF